MNYVLRVLLLVVLLVPMGVRAQVKAELAAADASAQPGAPLNIALHLHHEAPWHSFWKNAGTGFPTKLAWKLPPGWAAGEIQWPVPILVKDREGNITGHGYEGELYLPVSISVPADARPGQAVTLNAEASWLMCDKVCIPGKQSVVLTIPVNSGAAQPNVQVRTAIASMAMPMSDPTWKLAASNTGKEVALHVSAPAPISELHFYPVQKFISYKTPQIVASGDGKALLKLAIDPEEPPPADQRLQGVLAYTDGNGHYRGVDVDVPFTAPAGVAGTAGLKQQGVGNGGATASGPPATLSIGMLLLAMLGGLILNLMPCVFPVLGIKIVGFVEQAGADRRKVSLHSLSFTLGILLSFWALAGILALLRAGGQQLGWGFQLQSAPFVFGLAVVMLVFALNLSGLFEVGARATAIGGKLQMKEGVAGSFFSGVLATVVATPCSAPFLAPALGAALALPTAQSFIVFSAIGLGLALPYLLLSAFPQLIGLLPRPGRWMETFKQAMAFLLYATVGYLVWVLAGQTSEYGLLYVLLALTLVAMALWLYGRFGMLPATPLRGRVAMVASIALVAFALNLGWPRVAKSSDIRWEPWSSERVSQLRAEGRGIYIDFTARWCATCQVNKKVVFTSQDMRRYLQENNIATLRADWTNSDPLITAELQKWGRSAVPFNLVYRKGGDQPEPVVLPEVLTPEIVLRAFKGGKGDRK